MLLTNFKNGVKIGGVRHPVAVRECVADFKFP